MTDSRLLFSEQNISLTHTRRTGKIKFLTCRIHQTLRMTPAMAAGITNRLWEIEDVIDLLDNKSQNDKIFEVFNRKNRFSV